jgi:hypothetical protein
MNVLLAALVGLTVAQSAPDQYAYITAAPIPDWLGLATSSGRDAIQLGDGCAGVLPGVNVIQVEADEVQVVDPLRGLQPETCTILQRLHMSDVPCATNTSGACDIAFS